MGADVIRRARRAATDAVPAWVGSGLPPGTSASAVTVNPRRRGQRFRTWEADASQRRLDLQTARDPRLEGTRFHHCPQTARQLDSDNVGKESGAEEHPLDRRTQVTQTPVR